MNKTVKEELNIIFFDGVCNLCNFWVKFVIKNDPNGIFYFSSLQSKFAKSFMQQKNIKLDFETIIFYSRGKISQESEAIESILYVMGGFYRILSRLIKPIPINIRNLIYKLISKNRYRIFGKRERCIIPDDKIKQRFL